MKIFKEIFFLKLIYEASTLSKKRKHFNLHLSYQEKCQRLFNAIGCNSYIQPHRHILDNKTETLIAIKGLFALFYFDDLGNTKELYFFGSELHINKNIDAYGIEVLPNQWHTVIAMAPNSLLFEVKEGPFHPDLAKEMAPWAPKEDSEEALPYLNGLISQAIKQLK